MFGVKLFGDLNVIVYVVHFIPWRCLMAAIVYLVIALVCIMFLTLSFSGTHSER
jgi:uncharacterized membrane protein